MNKMRHHFMIRHFMKHHFKKSHRRTAPKKKRELFGAVLLLRVKAVRAVGILLFLLLLPYFFATFMGGIRSYEKKTYADSLTVVRQTDMGMEHIPLEEYLIGALAASIDPSCEPETLKAQAVILRTMVQKQYQNRDNRTGGEIDADMLQQEYMTLRQIKERFGEEFTAYYEKLQTAVKETEGCVIQYENIAVDTPYFYLSSGRTRSGEEVFGSADYPHLQSVESSADMLAPDYLCLYSYPKNQFRQKLQEMLRSYDGGEETPEAYQTIQIGNITTEQDSSGYVLVLEVEGTEIPGEFVRNFLQLNSACFTIEEQTASVEITTKGIGHGVGMSQYGANEMAKSGEDFIAILQHYFTNIEIQRN